MFCFVWLCAFELIASKFSHRKLRVSLLSVLLRLRVTFPLCLAREFVPVCFVPQPQTHKKISDGGTVGGAEVLNILQIFRIPPQLSILSEDPSLRALSLHFLQLRLPTRGVTTSRSRVVLQSLLLAAFFFQWRQKNVFVQVSKQRWNKTVLELLFYKLWTTKIIVMCS